MTFTLDNAVVDIPCPKCGQKIKEKIGRLKREQHITCQSCGRITVNTDELRRIERSIDQQLAKLGGTLKLKL